MKTQGVLRLLSVHSLCLWEDKLLLLSTTGCKFKCLLRDCSLHMGSRGRGGSTLNPNTASQSGVWNVSCLCVCPHLVPLLQLVVRELGVLPEVLQHLRPQLAVLFPHVSGTGRRRRFPFTATTGSAALAGAFFFFPRCFFFFSTPVNPRQEEWMSATIKQTGGWPPVTNERGGKKKTFSQQQPRARHRSHCRRSRWHERDGSVDRFHKLAVSCTMLR